VAAGLCVELGHYIQDIPDEIVELANLHHFPLIVFYKKVRFVDITHDLHTLIIKKNYQMISDLEQYSNRLNHLLLTSNPQQKILKLLYDHLRMSVFYIPTQGEIQVFQKEPSVKQNQILQLLKESKLHTRLNIARQSIQALNQKFADLMIMSDSEYITYESLILDRSATALAQNILRELHIEERRKTKETEWILKWLEGAQNEEQINRYLSDYEPGLKVNGCIVFLLKNDQVDEKDSEITHLQILSRSVFQSKVFFYYQL